MEKENDILSITYAKNLDKHNFNSIINLQIDSKVNVKTILNTKCYIFDEKIESASGKAVISGKLAVKVLYIDTDNITNTITETQPFSETILDNSITSDCFINLTNTCCLCEVLSNDGFLKVGCNVSFIPVVYVNLAMNTNLSLDENTICKNSNFSTYTISNKIDTSFNYTTNFEIQNNVTKILNHEAIFCLTNLTAQDGYAIVEGKLYSNLIYETNENEETSIKSLSDVFNIKTDVEITNLTQDSVLDLRFAIDNSAESITTEQEDDGNVISINNFIKVKGLQLKEISVEIVEDLYSTKNEIELSKTSREFICCTKKSCINEAVAGEISLNKEDPAIEEIILNTNINSEITNSYIKNGTIHIEGIVNSTVIYIDESKELRSKIVELPFIVNTKIENEILPTNHIDITLNTVKIKARRGTIIELEYELEICVCLFETKQQELIDNITLGKSLDFSQFDYQIFIAKPNETMWELCKRIKCHVEDINNCNKNLPLTFNGGEKVIIKR